MACNCYLLKISKPEHCVKGGSHPLSPRAQPARAAPTAAAAFTPETKAPWIEALAT